jgi:hypothetical protein
MKAIFMLMDTDGHCWIEDSLLLRCPITEFEARSVSFFDKNYPDALLVETNIETGYAQRLPDLFWKHSGRQLYMNVAHHTKAKEIRIRQALTPLLYQHKLHFRNNKSNRLGIQQIKELWSGTHDDYPDAIAMAIELMNSFLGNQIGTI